MIHHTASAENSNGAHRGALWQGLEFVALHTQLLHRGGGISSQLGAKRFLTNSSES